MSQLPPGSPSPVNYSTPPNKPSAGLAIASMILGIVSIFPGCCMSSLGIMSLLGLAAIILGFIANSQASQGRASGRGMALAGIITGFVGFLIGTVLLCLFLFGGQAVQRKLQDWQREMLRQQQQQQQQQQPTTQTSGNFILEQSERSAG
ncbi:MAG TPA: DUF4190 domain-containing protein [Humisphaera sp.]|nr:DUF4190 domain-containing protein [Humisphaera sp.]